MRMMLTSACACGSAPALGPVQRMWGAIVTDDSKGMPDRGSYGVHLLPRWGIGNVAPSRLTRQTEHGPLANRNPGTLTAERECRAAEREPADVLTGEALGRDR